MQDKKAVVYFKGFIPPIIKKIICSYVTLSSRSRNNEKNYIKNLDFKVYIMKNVFNGHYL